MLIRYLVVFAVVVIAGGIQGFVTFGSLISLSAASILGALALAGAYLLGKSKAGGSPPTLGLVLAALAFIGVAGRFVPAFIRAGDKVAALWPAGVFSLMAIIGLVLVFLNWRRKA